MKNPFRLFVLACLVASAGCSGSEPAAAPVATPAVTLNKNKAAVGSPLKITYRFDVAENAAIDHDYLVFLHVLEPDGEKMWQDDHQPPVPTSQWKPGQTVEYTRTIFVPNYPYIGEADLLVGLYDPAAGTRLPMAGTEAGSRAYRVARMEVLPSAENIFLIYKEGWHPAEIDGRDPTLEWQWTKQVATISLRNPKRDAVLYLDTDARTDLFNPPQQVTIKVAGQPVATFAADNKDRSLRTFSIKADQFGSDEMTEIVLEVDRTFSGTGDSRELGIRVYHAFVEPQ